MSIITTSNQIYTMKVSRKESDVSMVTPPVFFIVGCQRSGSNWLRTMLGEREDLFAPHPPHIMRDCLPILPKFGDLDKDVNNLKVNDNNHDFLMRSVLVWDMLSVHQTSSLGTNDKF